MSQKYESLSGFWTGVYDYPDMVVMTSVPDGAVAFNVLIVDIGGNLSGEVSEPNTISAAAVDTLFATIYGSRAGHEVTFVKTYIDVPDLTHQIRYEGTVNEDFTRIDGTWTTLGAYSWSGPFVMNRGQRTQAETRRESEADLIKLR